MLRMSNDAYLAAVQTTEKWRRESRGRDITQHWLHLSQLAERGWRAAD
jgi:hypothetical protein